MEKNNIKVYEIRIKVYILRDIPLQEILATEAEFIDSALAQDQRWLEYHEVNQYKNYCFAGLYPIEKEGKYLYDYIEDGKCRLGSVFIKYIKKSLYRCYKRLDCRESYITEKNYQ